LSMSLTMAVIIVGKSLVFAGLIWAAASDLARRIISNWLVLTVAAGGVILRLATANLHGIWASLGVAGIVFVALRLLSGFGALGGGDVKLITAITLGQSPAAMLPILLAIAVAGGVTAIFYLMRDRLRRRDEGQVASASSRHLEMPYAPAILAGVVWHELWVLVT
jgi:prepilin peptidase CpaA